jgi:hypothetical protein
MIRRFTSSWRGIISLLLILLVACSNGSGLQPFSSDGCSLFPDDSVISESDWCSCCFEHDLQYWRGGTSEERESSDRALRDCVLQKTGNEVLATAMYQGVRAGGSPYFYSWYRWGYGWSFDRKYQALTPAESKSADTLVEKYLADGNSAVCPI